MARIASNLALQASNPAVAKVVKSLDSESCVVPLEMDHLDSILRIEKSSYPNPWSASLIEAELQTSVGFSFGTLRGGVLQAYCFCRLIEADFEILNLCVDPLQRASGIGTALLLEVLKMAVLQGAKTAHLEVRPSNKAALSIYQKCHFKRVAVRRRYYSDNLEDAWVMSSELSVEQS